MKRIMNIKNRIYHDYFLPSRLNEYDLLIKNLLEQEYQFITFRDYMKKFNNKNLGNNKYFISRHDIDSDIATAKEFFRVEKKYNIQATYYFRLSTLDLAFMKEIEKYGSEASYHFEEIAQYAKDNHIKSKDEVLKQMPDIKKIFRKNFRMIEEKLGSNLKTVCSHGDFVNRKLNIINHEITKDDLIRNDLGILCETYDENIMQSFDLYLSDGRYPLNYTAEDMIADCQNNNIVCMLTHPRQWRSNGWVNTKENLIRVIEGIKW